MKFLGMGGFEFVIIIIVVLLIFGPKNLPKLGSALGKTVSNLRSGMNEGKKKKEEETAAEEASAKDDEKRAIQTEILEAVDEALKADEDVWEYAFGEEAFDLHDVGRAVAFELGDEKKADFYARRKDEREARSAERRSGLE